MYHDLLGHGTLVRVLRQRGEICERAREHWPRRHDADEEG
jgi:hypothetical protein